MHTDRLDRWFGDRHVHHSAGGLEEGLARQLTITWASKHGTSIAVIQFATQKTLGKCPKGTTTDPKTHKKTAWTRTKITGSITGGTGTAVKTIKKGQPVTGSICNEKTLVVEPGTSLKF